MSAIPNRVPAGPCVGRDRELARLRQAFEEASRGGERLVLVRGPSGVGKSRLMAELRSRVRLEGTAVVLEGRCTAGGRALAPLEDILRGAMRFLEEVGREAEVDLAPLAFLLGGGAPDEQPCRGMTRLERRVRFFEAYCSVLRVVSRIRPVLALVHDVHRADPAAVELLTHLLDGAGPWLDRPEESRTMFGLVVASSRTGDEPAGLERLASHPKAVALELGGFDAEALRELLQADEVVERLLAATGGNPAEVRALLETPQDGADCLLRRRLDELGPEARRLLAALAVLGRPSEAGLVARVAGVSAAARGVAELVDEGFVVKSLRDGQILLRAARCRVEELTYEWLSTEERRGLHLGAARAMAGASGLAAQDLARHAIRAGEAGLAIPAALEAALALELSYAFEAATRLLEGARGLADGDERDQISERLAELYTHTGEYRRALEHASQVLAARPREPAAALAVGRLRTLSGDYDGAAAALDAIAAQAEGLEGELAAEVAAARAEVRFWRGEYDEARAICAATTGGSPAAVLALENMLGKIELARGEHAAARGIFEDNLDEAREAGLEREEVHALINLGIVRLRQHDHEAAREHLEEALSISRRVGALRETAIALENLAVLAHFRRDYGAALDCYHAAVADLKRLGNRALLARAANNLGELYLKLGDPGRAARMCAFAEQMAGEGSPPAILAEGLLLAARVAVASGRESEARLAFARAEAVFAGLGERQRQAEATLAIARLELRAGDSTAARARLAAVEAVDGLDQVRLAEAALLESDLEAACFGDPLRSALVAADRFESAGDPDGAFRAHLRVALLLGEADDPDGTRRHLDRALSFEAKVSATVPAGFEAGLAADPDRARLREAADRRDRADPRSGQRAGAGFQRHEALTRRALPAFDSGRTVAVSNGIVYRSDAMRQVLEVVERAAASDSLVLVRGESGTGKELIADALHRLGPRRDRPFVKVNCGALVESLLMSELFGHEKGAFTGALQRRKGRFEAADGGTLFLDEIGDISPATQVSLLRVLQEQQFERVGGSKAIRTDVRIICATNRDLEALVRDGLFREDLYYRLKGIQIFVPALRDRPEDVEPLATHFLGREAAGRSEPPRRLDGSAVRALVGHPWPGNARELENVMRTVAVFVDGPVVTAADLAEFAELEAPPAGPPAPAAPPRTEPVAAFELRRPADPIEGIRDKVLGGEASLATMKKLVEQRCIEAALDETGGNITRAAELLGMKRPRLSQLVKEHGLSRRAERQEEAS